MQSQYLDPKSDAKLAYETVSTYQLGIDKMFLEKKDAGVLLHVCITPDHGTWAQCRFRM